MKFYVTKIYGGVEISLHEFLILHYSGVYVSLSPWFLCHRAGTPYTF
jgi:hypothetical protein